MRDAVNSHTHGVVSVTVNFYSALETQSLNSNVQFLGLLKKMFLYAQDGNGDDEAKIDFCFFFLASSYFCRLQIKKPKSTEKHTI